MALRVVMWFDQRVRVGNVRLVSGALRRRRGYRRLQLLRPDVQRALHRWGYCVTDERVTGDGLGRLRAAYDMVAASMTDLDPERFTPLNPRTTPGFTAELRAEMDAALRPPMERLTTADARFTPSVFQSKPSSVESAVDPHQDSILVDERVAFGAYAWVPLADVGAGDGALYVVPGSHRFGCWNRAPATGAELEHLRGVIAERARMLPVAAGQVVLFDHAAMHGSVANRSGTTRVAVGGVIRPAGQWTYTSAITEATPPGKMELYRYPPAVSGLDDAALAGQREHVGTVPRADLQAGARAFSAVCRIESVFRPGAPGLAIRTD